MPDEFKPGDRVEWGAPQGKTMGKIKRELTSPMDIEGHHVAASQDSPEHLVESEKSVRSRPANPKN